MSLQPTDSRDIDRTATAPFLLRCFWKAGRDLNPNDFSVAPPLDPAAQDIVDYSQILPGHIRQQSCQIYTWPTCTLRELTGLLATCLPEGTLPKPAVGTRLVYRLIFPDTRAEIRSDGRGKWSDKPLGTVVIGGRDAHPVDDDEDNAEALRDSLEGDAGKTLADARFVIGDYVSCAIYPPGQDGRIPPVPAPRPPMRGDPYESRARPPPPRENGNGGYGRAGGGYRGGYGGGSRGGNGFSAPPPGDWRRGERPPGRGYGGGGFGRGGRRRPY
ncbi:hypothetical protein EJ03DRAFT_330202 [Teratosphaeria nubilosa]|uniref:Sin3-associated polypeptide Sap18 n=1 Tax=Teratosphaeria nubilosa TaxID=161662 RepID=A0A6G1L276_9PEZI|nr:hypothetical protein EJ03DRAFT_330202 [Teratosphaeria nubilosa]